LNPIEQAFANLKALLCTAASRTVEALWQAIGQALDAFTPAGRAHYLAHAGYVPSSWGNALIRSKQLLGLAA
jgi:hypothetical protein